MLHHAATATGNLVEGNLIGTDMTGTVALGNATRRDRRPASGHPDRAQSNTIGGTAHRRGQRHLGQRPGTGIEITGTAVDNLVEGNLSARTPPAPPRWPTPGRRVIAIGADDNTIGGTAAGAGNVISGNTSDGVEINGTGRPATWSPATSSAPTPPAPPAWPTANDGVDIDSGASGNTIGGGSTAAANVISGNTGYGIQVDGATTIGNILANNWVGTGAVGSGTVLNSGGALEITNGAAVLATGAFTGNVVNQGTLGFWNDAPGVITITGNYTQNSAGTLDVDLGGTSRSQYNQLQVSGTATLAGTLDVALIDGFSISPVEEFQVLSYGTLSGEFATDQYPSGVTLYPSYGPTSLSLFSTSIFEVVTTTADAGAGSLRQAITIADASSNSLTSIAFDIPTSDSGYKSGAWTISPASPLPEITAPVVLDGTTQPGFTSTPLIELDGTTAGSSASGLTISASTWHHRQGPDHRRLRQRWHRPCRQATIPSPATTSASTPPAPNREGNGRPASSCQRRDDNTIGGTTAGAGNVISANAGDGVDDIDANANLIAGNWIGTNAAGTAALAQHRRRRVRRAVARPSRSAERRSARAT